MIDYLLLPLFVEELLEQLALLNQRKFPIFYSGNISVGLLNNFSIATLIISLLLWLVSDSFLVLFLFFFLGFCKKPEIVLEFVFDEFDFLVC